MGKTNAVDEDPDGQNGTQEIRVLCKVDVTGHDLSVDWTDGAIFHFGSKRQADHWVEGQNEKVPGRFLLKTHCPGEEPLQPDFYLYYNPPSS